MGGDHHNHTLHEDPQHVVLGNDELNSEVERECQKGYWEVPSELRFILNVTMQEVKKYSVWRKRMWLEDLQAARELVYRQRHDRERGQSSLDQWLQS